MDLAINDSSPSTPKTSSKHEEIRTVIQNGRGGGGRSVDTYAAQCETCLKWRVIDTQEEYEEIRSKILENPFFCHRKSGISCEDPADIECNATRTWVIDKPGIPKTPEGFTRSLVLRRDFSKMDAYYFTPTGKKLRTRNEIVAFLESDSKYKDLSVDNFIFTSPKVMEETIPEEAKVLFGSGNKKKLLKESAD